MKIKRFIYFILMLCSYFSFGQNPDSVVYTIQLPDIIISATRTPVLIGDIPVKIEKVTSKELSIFPLSNFDNILQSVPNIYVNRSAGIFSKNSSVTMRGMDGTNRVLVMYDGIPLNKSSGGGINWHIVDFDNIAAVEIIKGSNSAVYGGNAMAGSIHIFSKIPENPFEIKSTLSFATYNTKFAKLYMGGNLIKKDKGFFWSINGFYRKGDGYFFVKEEEKDSMDNALYLTEISAVAKLGYQFNKHSYLIVHHNFYNDNRGDGIKIFEKNGGYNKSVSNISSAEFHTKITNWNLHSHFYFHHDNIEQHTEKYSANNPSYKLYDVYQLDKDYGMLTDINRQINKHRLTFGFDQKTGTITACDIYRTSTDEIYRSGSLSNYAFFIQDEYYSSSKINIVAGLRFEYSHFYKANLEIINPTSTTGFTENSYLEFPEPNWYNISPKLGLKYRINSTFTAFFSYAQGFIPPKLDDMVSSRKITKGFKLANPDLKPEYSNSLEIGFTSKPLKYVVWKGSIYYTTGKDFQYFVQTGEVVDDVSLVFKRINIGEVEILGCESDIVFQPTKKLQIKANYTYNYSIISQFPAIGEAGMSLKGKFISETPAHQAFFGINWSNKYFNTGLAFNYIGEQWGDEINSFFIQPYNTFDIKFSGKLSRNIELALLMQNIFDVRYVDKKNGISPGRFIEFSLIFGFQKDKK